MSHFCVYVFHKEDSDLNEILRPYDENLEVPTYVEYTREQAIASVRKQIDEYEEMSTYKEFIKDPIAYKEKWAGNNRHLDFLEFEIPKMRKWTDDECYEYKAEPYKFDNMVDDNGNLMSNYNPKSKWDWWAVGGRYGGLLNGHDSMMVVDLNVDEVEIPYAYVDANGVWHERGHVGMFAIATDEMAEDEWNKQFKNYLKSISNDNKIELTVVDCHI